MTPKAKVGIRPVCQRWQEGHKGKADVAHSPTFDEV